MTAHATKAPPLAFTPPCLAIVRAQPPTGSNWVHEFKCDGYRVRALIDACRVRSLMRNAFDWTPRFGAVIEDFAGLGVRSAVIDSEAVVLAASGVSGFFGAAA